MSQVIVNNSSGQSLSVDVRQTVCKKCGTTVAPIYLCYSESYLFCKCPIYGCGNYFLLKRDRFHDEYLPNQQLGTESFSDIINEISPSFVIIYNEAYSAEQMLLSNICGAGYRKALEFLVKDYLSKDKSEEERGAIQKKPLAKCIEDDVADQRIKSVAKRAVWIGNDETHYIKKWEQKDVNDLKGVIHLTIRWIEQEVETEQLLADMPEPK